MKKSFIMNDAGKVGVSMRSSMRRTLMDQTGAGKYKIGNILVKEGVITHEQLREAIDIKDGRQ